MPRKRKSKIERVRTYLLSGKKLTPKSALTRFGTMRLAAIIHVLRNSFNMNKETDTRKKYATYSLVS